MKQTSIFLLLCFYALCSKAQSVIPTTVTTSQATSIPDPVQSAYLSSAPINYVRIWTAQKPVIAAGDIGAGSATYDFIQQTQYLDGLGRLLQTVNKAITPLGKDLVTPLIYDQFGRETFKYLPYASTSSNGSFKADPFAEQATFMQSQFGDQGETFFYGKTEFEASPLDRVLRTWAPGNSWVGSPSSNRSVGTNYGINEANEVLLWNIDLSSSAIPSVDLSNAFYGSQQLYRTVTMDEHGKRIVEYKNKEGQIILKKVELTDHASLTLHEGWLCTYYVYDDLDNLRYVIQPKAVEEMRLAQNWSLGATQLKELCFHYEYDAKRRMVLKHVPGADDIYMVYDAKDRLVYTQDGNMRAKNWWAVSLYDEINRTTSTGIMVYSGQLSELQNYMADPAHLNGFNTINIRGSNLQSNLVAVQRDPVITDYIASANVDFSGEFESTPTDEFVAEISTAVQPSIQKEVPGNLLLAPTDFYPLTFSYYDDYFFTSTAYNTANKLKLDVGPNPASGNLYVESLSSSASNLTKGVLTGSKVWVLEDANDLTKGRWLETVSFYDDKGRIIQTQANNINDGKESLTSLYDFSGKVLCTYQVHQNPFSALGEIRIKTNMDYDAGGRLLQIRKQFNDDPSSNTVVVKNEYDELGQLKNKYQGYNDNRANDFNGEDYWNKLSYEYNIRGWLRGINKDYANNNSNPSTGFSFFGEELSYDYGFSKQQYNGNIAGIKWRSYGDGEERAYGFEYDNANRLTKADFTQLSGSTWNNSIFDFSVSGKNGKIEYDENGNILFMKQMAWKPGGSFPIDDMQYRYFDHSNKLLSVTEETSIGIVDYKQGDFTDKNTSNDDYNYDVNGNLIQDKNKGITAITYNHLNLPYKIDIPGKGYIIYIYDAAGNKIKKIVHDQANATTDPTTTYMGAFVYQDNEIQFVSHEEGRFRYKPAQTLDMGDGYTYTYPAYFVTDYFIKDHLGNIRTVFTNELKTDWYPAATMEDGNASLEDNLYSNLNSTRSDLPNDYPADANNQKVAKVGGIGGNKVGPSILLKVMAGDGMRINVDSWYKTAAGTNPDPPEGITDLAAILASSVDHITGGKITSTQLLNSGSFTSGIGQILSNIDDDPSKPKASLNWILFDDHFNIVEDSYGYDPVPDESAFSGSGGPQVYKHVVPYLAIPKNGYIYVFVSNETPNIPVYFDNLQVTHIRGPLIEDTHYYPFGLSINGINSKAFAFGGEQNKRKYSGKELENREFSDGSGLEWYDYGARTYDMQIGRWHSLDGLAEKYNSLSPYSFVANDPILLYDPDGQRIKIKYKDDEGHKRKAYYDASDGVAKDKSGNVVHGDFVDKVVESLNQVKAADENKVIETVADSKKTVTIKRAGYGDKHENEFRDGIFHLGLSKKIFFNPDRAAETYKLIPWRNPITGTNQPNVEMTGGLSPSMILFHEVVHVFNYFNDRSATLQRLRSPAGDYGNAEEQLVIDKYETPAAVLLDQGTRNHHRSLHTFPVIDPTKHTDPNHR